MAEIRTLYKGFAVWDMSGRKISIREPLNVVKVGGVVHLVNERFEIRLSRRDDGKVVYAFYFYRQVLVKGIVVWMPRIPFILKLLNS